MPQIQKFIASGYSQCDDPQIRLSHLENRGDRHLQTLGRDARAAVLAGLQPDMAALRQKCIALRVGFHEPADDEHIESLSLRASADLPEL